MSSASAIDLSWLQKQFPDLTNLAPLSQGGQKLVLAATHPTDGDVVLKLIHPNQAPETTQRELLAVTQLNGARVPEIFASGVLSTPIGDWVWFRERRILGETVREQLARGPFVPAAALRLGHDVLECLVAAETAHIVHRDVKPDNVICDKAGFFWLIDFGVARHLDLHSLTATAHPFGKCTPGYAPPEQFRNVKADIDSRCDLFAVGVTLHECATGTNPFTVGARDHLEKFARVEKVVLPRLGLPIKAAAEFSDLVAALTQKRRDHRPRTAHDAYNWMKQICDAEGP